MIKFLFSLLLIASLSFAQKGKAEVKDSALVEHNSLWKELDKRFLINPAFRNKVYKLNFSEVYYGFKSGKNNAPFAVEEGLGMSEHSLNVNTHLTLSANTAVWGSAAYVSSVQRKIKWNSISDYQLMAPYVIADSIGGNTRIEKYLFSGGYATSIRNWSVGGEMLFRAQQEYRNKDPRMRSIVSDLSIRVGVARKWNSYELAMASLANIYKQTNNVEFYKEDIAIPEFFMTGNASFMPRFSGKKTGAFYQGGGTGLHLSVKTLAKEGFWANACFNNQRYERIASEFNSFPSNKVFKEKANVLLGWKHEKALNYNVFAGLTLDKIRGEERIAGVDLRGDFPVIASLTMYKENVIKTYLGTSWNFKSNVLHVYGLQIGYEKNKRKYVYPERLTNYSRAFVLLQTQFFASVLKDITLSWYANARYEKALSNKIVMPFVNMQPSLRYAVQHNYAVNTAHLVAVEAGVRADCPISQGQYGLFFTLGGSSVHAQNVAHANAINLSVGLRF